MAKNSSFGHLLTPLQLLPSRGTQICFKCDMFISGQFEEFSFQKATTFTSPKKKNYTVFTMHRCPDKTLQGLQEPLSSLYKDGSFFFSPNKSQQCLR